MRVLIKSRSAARRILLFVLTLLNTMRVFAGEEENRWWPIQVFPKAIVRTTSQQDFPEPRLALQMMVQSVVGLAAKAVNEGHGNELVWINNGEGDLEKWHARLLAQHPGLELPGAFSPWELAERYGKRGIIRGYILYHSDKPAYVS